MYEIEYYKDNRGKSEVKELIHALKKKTDKNSKINDKKISTYIRMLKVNGLNLREPYIKHVER